MTANDIIQQLQLEPHPEGGFFKETYRSNEQMHTSALTKRNVCTSIYYLLENSNKSVFHKIKSDEHWYFHQGNALEVLSFQNNNLVRSILGANLAQGELPYVVIPANTWFASHIQTETGFSLVSCVVSPGFDFEDFEIARKSDLQTEFPLFKEIIDQFT